MNGKGKRSVPAAAMKQPSEASNNHNVRLTKPRDSWMAKGAGALVDTIELSSVEPCRAPVSSNPEGTSLVCSYNWADHREPTIYVPGGAPKWNGGSLHLPQQLQPDVGKIFVDQNRARVAHSPLEPLFRAAEIMTPDLRFDGVDVVVNRNSLRKLLTLCEGGSPDSFRVDLSLVHSTLIVERCERNAQVLIGGGGGGGGAKKKKTGTGTGDAPSFGHSFERATTVAPSGLENSAAHHRALRYKIGDMDCVVRFEVDAELGENDEDFSSVIDQGIREGGMSADTTAASSRKDILLNPSVPEFVPGTKNSKSHQDPINLGDLSEALGQLRLGDSAGSHAANPDLKPLNPGGKEQTKRGKRDKKTVPIIFDGEKNKTIRVIRCGIAPTHASHSSNAAELKTSGKDPKQHRIDLLPAATAAPPPVDDADDDEYDDAAAAETSQEKRVEDKEGNQQNLEKPKQPHPTEAAVPATKTKTKNKKSPSAGVLLRRRLPQLWFGRTPNLVVGYHDAGNLRRIEITRGLLLPPATATATTTATTTKTMVTGMGKFQEWEERPRNQDALRKMAGLLRRMREVVVLAAAAAATKTAPASSPAPDSVVRATHSGDDGSAATAAAATTTTTVTAPPAGARKKRFGITKSGGGGSSGDGATSHNAPAALTSEHNVPPAAGVAGSPIPDPGTGETSSSSSPASLSTAPTPATVAAGNPVSCILIFDGSVRPHKLQVYAAARQGRRPLPDDVVRRFWGGGEG